MPVRVPALDRHSATGQARVRINGRDFYLGPYGSAEAEEKCRHLIAEWLSTDRTPVPPSATPQADAVTVRKQSQRFPNATANRRSRRGSLDITGKLDEMLLGWQWNELDDMRDGFAECRFENWRRNHGVAEPDCSAGGVRS